MSSRRGTPRRSGASYGHSRSSAHVYASARKKRSSRGSLGFTLAAILVLAAVVGGGVLLWINRTVNVKVDGALVSVRADATLADIAEAQEISVAPGDLVSVGGNVLTEGEGAPFSATVNGKELDADQIEAFRAKGNEEIVFGDGADVTEPYHEEERETQPKMEPYEKIGAVTYVAQWPKAGKAIYMVGDTSGETALKEETEPVQNLVIESVNPQPEDGSKVIALTFDDGPNANYTQKYLDILDKYGIKATFFCLGPAAEKNPDLVKAIKDQGSQVASHTKSHGDPLSTLDADTLRSEISDAFDSIEGAGGGATTVIRPPYGDFNNQTWLDSNGTLSASVIWNLDSEDWTLPGADAIVSNCTNGAYSGAIILMHDGGGNRDQDLEALPRIIENLQDKGYKFVTINELMAMDSRIPEDVASGNATMPEDGAWPTEMVE
ncbi:polysaccharide deacetylase family protein [Olsenella sp. DSM 107455]|uniref:Polysaccharide deacetylase family protein n=1 Tax=Thermophilibacter gallinarum TaxID=2779357 RepID=A0ABR9QTJ0_9ACTN|nr:polysaccharide deacetylase family protein [Thermophilibacter gallinarum]MBE5024385.1 polysaccharide deacetylase family protein [Thermophilibacter gallinarum]